MLGIGFTELLILVAVPIMGLIGVAIVFLVVRTVMRAESQKNSDSRK
jgi:hypothetical protein